MPFLWILALTTPRAAAMDILYYDGGAVYDNAKAALDKLGLTYTSATSSNFTTSISGGTYEVAVIDLPSSKPSGSWTSALATFISGGGRVVMGYYNISGDSTLGGAFQVSSSSVRTSMSSLYRWDTSHAVFNSPYTIPNFTSYTHVWSYEGNELSVSSGGTAIGGFSSSSSSTRGGIVVGNGGLTIYNGINFDSYTADQNGNGTRDIIELVANEITYVMSQGCDEDGDGYDSEVCSGDDCDDTDATVHPGASEYCDGEDDDCDGSVDESAVDMDSWYRDIDDDGYGDEGATATISCTEPVGYVANNNDCDDHDPEISPAADEYCDGIDNDCDGSTDESDALDEATWYRDGDGDTYGDATRTRTACDQPSGYVSSRTDCDDGNADINPAADEICDALDNDCDGSTDEAGAVDGATYYRDKDKDGYGDSSSVTTACNTPSGYATNPDDCDDTSSAVSPASSERCNGKDDDCDGSTDEADAVDGPDWYADADGDTYGDPDNTTAACSAPSGYVSDSRDCDDYDAAINPAADEHCDSVDEDCDGTVDDHAVDEVSWYRDADSDGYGTSSLTSKGCTAPSGYIDNDDDCNDSNASINPLGTETAYDGIDQDCDGGDLIDLDADGYDADFKGGDDCDDSDASIHPGTPETADGSDEDCDGEIDDGTTWGDDDGDGVTEVGGDCDDSDGDSWPGGMEVADGADNDCDGTIDEGTEAYDDDGDGWSEEDGDCVDGDASVSPGEAEVPDNGVDDDCDGLVDDGVVDNDGDGYADEVDCGETDPATHPGADELDDGQDNDCDGTIDEGTTGGDDDFDGYSENGGDCDDTDELVFPGAAETVNGQDDDCDGQIDEGTEVADDDGDGISEDAGDCDDTSASVAPGHPEVAANGIDDDCDGEVDEIMADADGDGVSVEAGDCDDNNGWARPGLPEMCDGFDNDCDGNADEELVDCDLATDTGDTGKTTDPGACGCQSTGGTGAGISAFLGVAALLRRRQRR